MRRKLLVHATRERYQISDSIKAFSGSFKVPPTICGGERYDFQIGR